MSKCHLKPCLHVDKPASEGLTLETTLEHTRTTSTEKSQTGKSAGEGNRRSAQRIRSTHAH